MRLRVIAILFAAVAAGLVACDDGGSSPPVRLPPPEDVDERARECELSADCAVQLADLGPCEVPRCLPGEGVCAAAAVNDGTPCDDGDACTDADFCSAGECVGGAAVACDDGNPCTADECRSESGCVSPPAERACDDGNPCTVGDRCAGGQCVGGANSCVCENDADCAAYDDRDRCNGALRCERSAAPFSCEIEPATVVTCDGAADTPCAAARCDPATGTCALAPRPDGTPCDDGDTCTVGDACAAGACVPGAALSCDDGDGCTVDTCEPGSGCVSLPDEGCAPCEGLDCLACAHGERCAPGGEHLPGTCCAQGDSLLYLASGLGAEVVDIETDGALVVACGGFGARISDITRPASPVHLGSATRRCQRIAFGRVQDNGDRVVYLAHHGDTWVGTPSLQTFRVDAGGGIHAVDSVEEDGVLYEGLAWGDGYLYVADHAGGVRVYATAPDGTPALRGVVRGFANATELVVDRRHLYVADGVGGLKVLGLEDPEVPRHVQTLETAGLARDVDAEGGRVYVALAGNGFEVFDAPEPDALVRNRVVEAMGSVQAVAADGHRLAVAAWSHLALYDTSTLALLGTEEVRRFPAFDQVLGVAIHGDIVLAGEWEGFHVVQHRDGYVAPDIWVEEELFSFPAGERMSRAVIVRNRGLAELKVRDIIVADPGRFSVNRSALSIPPGEADVFELTYDPGGDVVSLESSISLHTNDPDSNQSPLTLHLVAGASDRIDVGDPLGAEFAFLDPSGSADLEGLRGNVIVLAYFALF